MIEMNIPGRGKVQIDYLVCDVNGTLAVDGVLLPGVISMLKKIKDTLQVFLITANTHGKQGRINEELGIEAVLIQKNEEKEQKRKFISSLGSERVIAIGQGANDAGMLKDAAIGICVQSEEGTAATAIMAADILVKDTITALQLIQHPMRLVATLRE